MLRALQLGDLLCAVPAFRALRGAFPRAEITLVGLAWARELVDRFDAYLDDFLELPGWPGLPETQPRLDEIPAFLAEAQRRRFDLAVQLHGSGGVTNPLALLLGARETAGFYRPGDYCPDPARFLRYPEGEHEVETLLRLTDFLGVARRGDELEFPLRGEDYEALRSIDEAASLATGPYACVHPGGRNPEARWDPERFAAVADALAARGLRVVLTGSAGEEDVVAAVAARMQAEPLVLAGRTSLGALAALLAESRLLVSNDTGVAHLAAALAVPSVVVFRESQLRRWGPRGDERRRAVLKEAALDDVLAAADELLRAVAAAA